MNLESKKIVESNERQSSSSLNVMLSRMALLALLAVSASSGCATSRCVGDSCDREPMTLNSLQLGADFGKMTPEQKLPLFENYLKQTWPDAEKIGEPVLRGLINKLINAQHFFEVDIASRCRNNSGKKNCTVSVNGRDFTAEGDTEIGAITQAVNSMTVEGLK